MTFKNLRHRAGAKQVIDLQSRIYIIHEWQYLPLRYKAGTQAWVFRCWRLMPEHWFIWLFILARAAIFWVLVRTECEWSSWLWQFLFSFVFWLAFAVNVMAYRWSRNCSKVNVAWLKPAYLTCSAVEKACISWFYWVSLLQYWSSCGLSQLWIGRCTHYVWFFYFCCCGRFGKHSQKS